MVVLDDAPWARRAIGVLANEMMRAIPNSAIVVLARKGSGGFTVSVRVPADTLGEPSLVTGSNHNS